MNNYELYLKCSNCDEDMGLQKLPMETTLREHKMKLKCHYCGCTGTAKINKGAAKGKDEGNDKV